jgi:hypothetical protein
MHRPSVEMYLCAFHVGKRETDESVEEAYHRALDITAAQFRRMQKDDCSALQEKHADANDLLRTLGMFSAASNSPPQRRYQHDTRSNHFGR